MRSPMLDDLGAIDPAREVQAPGHPDDDALAGILAQSRVAPGSASLEADRRRRPARVAAIAGSAAAVAIAVAVTTVVWDAPAAYASWTPVPAAVDAEQAAQAEEQCGGSVTEIVEGPDGPSVEEVPVTPVLVDVRGDYTYVVTAGDGAYGECFVTAGADGEAPQVVASSAAGTDLTAPGSQELTTLQSGTASWSEGDGAEGALTSAFGQVGDDVTAVELTLTDGDRVQASVSDGWWAAWAPGGSALGTSAQVTYTDGTTAQVDLQP